MHIRTFRASSLQAALAEIRRQMGPSASVLHTRTVRGGLLGTLGLGVLGRPRVEVTAGLDDAPVVAPHSSDSHALRSNAGAKPPDGFAASSAAKTVVAELMGQGIEPSVARELVRSALEELPPEQVSVFESIAHRVIARLAAELPWGGPIRTAPGQRRIVALVGPTGVGKTTTVAKLAAGFRLEEQRQVGLITLDTYRVAAVQQLQAYAEIMDLPMEVVEKPGQMRPALERLRHAELILIDTVGGSPQAERQVAQLAELLGEAVPDEVHLVLSATTSAQAVREIVEGFAPVRPTAMILSKTDEVRSPPGLLAALRSSAVPLSYLTIGQRVPEDIVAGSAGALAACFATGAESATGAP